MKNGKYRASMHNGKRSQKTGGVIDPKHNDTAREKNLNVAKQLVQFNVYFNCYDGEYTEESKLGKLPFKEVERRFYNERYGAALEVQNEKYRKARQYKRVKTMDDWLKSSKYAPTETILRLGNVDDGYPDSTSLLEMGKEYVDCLNEWSQKNNNCLHILDWSLHADEVYKDDETGEIKPSTPHIHIRWVMDYVDENGNRAIGKDKALQKAGYDIPNTTKKEGRYNNRSMDFSAECRELFQIIGMHHGYDIETEPLPIKQKSTDKESYIARKRAEKREQKARDTQMEYQKLKEQQELFQIQLNAALAAFEKEKEEFLEKEKLLDSEVCDNKLLKSQLLDQKKRVAEFIANLKSMWSELLAMKEQAENLITDIRDAKSRQELVTKYKSLSNRYNYAVNNLGVDKLPTDENELSF